MSERIFNFDPSKYAAEFAKAGYVHIKGGVTESFYAKAVKQVEENMKSKLMKEFAIGDKQQAMYEFPEGADYGLEVRQTVAGVTGLPENKIILSERHIKAYDKDAASEPLAHKDRYASEISLGLSIHVRDGSTLVLYPYDDLEVNPFNASQILRASLSQDRYPEPALKKARRVEIRDQARDVIMFRGHSIWHLRANPALTTMLYLKLNTFNCDPLGEDARTPDFKARTLASVEMSDGDLEKQVALIGRRVDYFHRHITRDFKEVLGVVIFGEKHFSIDEEELKMIKLMDGKRTAGAIVSAASEFMSRQAALAGLRRLGRRGVIDLVPPEMNA